MARRVNRSNVVMSAAVRRVCALPREMLLTLSRRMLEARVEVYSLLLVVGMTVQVVRKVLLEALGYRTVPGAGRCRRREAARCVGAVPAVRDCQNKNPTEYITGV